MLLIGALMLLMSKPQDMTKPATGWITIARSADGTSLEYDKATLQRSGDQRAAWLRVGNAAPTARGVKTSTFLVWLDCKRRRYNLMISIDDDVRGVRLAQRSYGGNGKGFESVKPGTAVAGAMATVCG